MNDFEQACHNIKQRLPFLRQSQGRPCLARLITGGRRCPHSNGRCRHLPCDLHHWWGRTASLWLTEDGTPDRIAFFVDLVMFDEHARLVKLCTEHNLEAEIVSVGVSKMVVSLRTAAGPRD